MRKIASLLGILLFLTFAIDPVKASTIFEVQTTDCSGQGGTDYNGSNIANACNNTVNTEPGTLLTAWGDPGHPVIHIKADSSDNISLKIDTPGVFLPNYTYTVVDWTTTLTNWTGWIGGGWFDCNGLWGCPALISAPGGIFQGETTATGHTDYYIVVASHCQGVTSGCYTNLTISCSACSIAEPPTPPPPVTKVVFVPGLGASWNAKAILTCGEADSSGWTMMPIAAQYYDPIINALTNAGKNVTSFYYDWRAPVQSNSQLLSQSLPDEKVDIVSHSMGGLVSRGLIQKINANNINSLYLVGVPNQGSVVAYPAWQWGEIWNDNFIYKVALNVYLKACDFKNKSVGADTIHQLFPSIQDLLPTYSGYVQDKKGNLIENLPENNWLKELNNKELPNIKIGTLSGNGFNTLTGIIVKDSYIQKSTGKISTTSGDGTVLSSSSRISNISDDKIDYNHIDLIASSSGIARVFDFLGIQEEPVTTASFQEPNSALIVGSYASNFWLSDQSGNIYKDNHGMVSFINPKSGSYKLNLLPNSSNTLLVIAQFLPNGDVKYKEYNLQGFGPKFKILKFDAENPSDDILN